MKKVLIACALATTVTACHCPWHQTPEERAARINEMVTDKLDLNDGQSAKLKDVTDEGLVIVKEFQRQREADLALLTQQVTQPELDKEKLLAIYQQRRAVLDQQLPVLIDKLAELHKSLTPEQKAQLAERLQKLADR